jgi:hypothetical protein
MPPPPIPAIALAAIRLFILGAKAQKAVPKPAASVPLRENHDHGRALTKERESDQETIPPSDDIAQSSVDRSKAADRQ